MLKTGNAHQMHISTLQKRLMETFYTIRATRKAISFSVMILILLLISGSTSLKAQCNVNAINRVLSEYGSPCEGDVATLTPVLYSGYHGTITWFRSGGAMPQSAYVYQNQLYINPYYNSDAGWYAAIYTDNSSGCKDTGWIQTDQLTPQVQPQIQRVKDLCNEVQMKAVNLNDTAAGDNTYAWMDQNGNFTIYSQYINSNHYTETVQITNTDGCSAATTEYIPESQMTTPSRPSVISGTAAGLCGLTNKIYSVNQVQGVTYQWSVPDGATINSGQGTNSIHVSFPSDFFSEYISVIAENNCGTSLARNLTVKSNPAAPAAINGPATVCSGSSAIYSIASIANIANYTWTAPSGSHITANGVTSSNNVLTTSSTTVSVVFGALTSTSVMKARGNNDCGNGASKSKPLTPCSPRLESTNESIVADVYPNPVSTVTFLRFTAAKESPVHFSLLDATGRAAMDQEFRASEGANELMLDLKQVPPGIYVGQLSFEDHSAEVRIVKD